MISKNFEKYRLRMEHDWSDGNGHFFEAEKPITVECTVQNTLGDYNTHSREQIVGLLCDELEKALLREPPHTSWGNIISKDIDR